MWSGGKCSGNDAMRIWRCLNRCTPNPTLSLFHPIIAERVPGLKHPRPWHCSSTHPVWWGHHPGWCLSANSSLTPSGSLVRNEWHRGEECNPSTQCDDILLSPSTKFGMWWHPWWPHPWRMVDLHMASRFPAGLSAMVWMPRASWSLRHWCHWWRSWCWTSVTFESMIWWEWRQLGWCHP